MKLNKIVYLLMFSAMLMIGMQSCFQDLDQDPAFNYPEEKGDPVGVKGEVLYFSFDGDAKESVTGVTATTVGAPTYQNGKEGKAYVGATDSYLKFTPSSLIFEEELTVSFWYNMNTQADRAGMLAMTPGDPNNPNDNKLYSGFRLFREGSATAQKLKLSLGLGTSAAPADIWVTNDDVIILKSGEWQHIAFTVSKTKAMIYVNGEIFASQDIYAPLSWDGANLLSIGSGAPNFIGWGHLSDSSMYDELRIFKKTLTQPEIQALARN